MVLAVDAAAAKPGLIGFLVVAALGVATFFLLRSMVRQVRKIDFDEGEDDSREAPDPERADEADRGGRDAPREP